MNSINIPQWNLVKDGARAKKFQESERIDWFIRRNGRKTLVLQRRWGKIVGLYKLWVLFFHVWENGKSQIVSPKGYSRCTIWDWFYELHRLWVIMITIWGIDVNRDPCQSCPAQWIVFKKGAFSSNSWYGIPENCGMYLWRSNSMRGAKFWQWANLDAVCQIYC